MGAQVFSRGDGVRGWRAARAWWPWVRRLPNKHLWLWTPITYRFGHGGWIYLNLAWLWRFKNGFR